METSGFGQKIKDLIFGNKKTDEKPNNSLKIDTQQSIAINSGIIETNPYFIYKHGFINEEFMTPGPKTLNLFKVVNANHIPSILAGGVKPYNILEQERKKPDFTHTLIGEGDASFWTLGKVNFFYGGKDSKVLLELDDSNIFNKDGVLYRKTDPRQTWAEQVPFFDAKELSLENLPQNYWNDWWRSFEVAIPFVVASDKLKITPLDNSAKHFLDSNSISYETEPIKYPITEHWGACACGSEDGPMGYHKNDGWCG